MTTTKPCGHSAATFCACEPRATAAPEKKEFKLGELVGIGPTWLVGKLLSIEKGIAKVRVDGVGMQHVPVEVLRPHCHPHVPPESVPAQDWENKFIERFGYIEQKGQPVPGEVLVFIRQAIAAAREEGRHQGLIEAGKLVDEINDHTKKQQPGRVMYMQGIEEGRRQREQEILALIKQYPYSHHQTVQEVCDLITAKQ